MKLIDHITQHRPRLDMTGQDLTGRLGVRRQAILVVETGPEDEA